jgi:4a-hydroxytetrahydrobiopterin dehydratase
MKSLMLTEEEITARLTKLPAWSRDGAEISRTVQRADFVEAMKLVNAVAEIAERRNHHPDITIRWNRVTLTLSTHSAGGLTDLDFAAAEELDQAAA